MLTFEDCVALSGLTQAEVDAIAEHEHLPEMVAVELGNYLLCCENGELQVRSILADDLWQAEKRGDQAKIAELRKVLKYFVYRCKCGADAKN